MAAWRGPLLVAALTLAVVGAVVVVAGVRTARERDRALAAEASLRDTNGSLWTDRASAALAASQDLEAARAAREALALRDHPEALGVALLARSDLVAGPVGGAPCPRWVRPAPGGWLCGERDGVSLRDASGGVVRRWPVLAHDALFDGERILALTDGKVVDLVAPDAPPAYRGPATHGLQPGGLLADRTDWWDLRDPSRAPIRPCPPPETHDGTLRVGDGGYAACSGGQLVEIVGTTRRVVPTEAAVLARVNELAMGADGLLWLGSLDGEVRAVRADDGRLVGAVDAGVGALRRLLPGAPWGVAVGQDGRARLVDPGEQRLGPALPVPGVLDVGWDGERLLVATREGFTEVLGVAEASASRWFAPSGVASVDLGADRVAVGLSGMVEVRTWPGGQRVRRASPQAAMVKAVALDGDGVVAASVDDAGARVRLALDGSPDEAFDEVRRLRRLVRGGDGTLLGVPYVASLWRAPPGEAPTVSAAPAMLVDVVAAGAWAWGLDADGRRWSVRLADGAMSPVAEPDAPPARVLAVSPDGSTLATLSSRGVAVGAPDGPAREVLEAADLTAVDVGPHGLLLGFLDGRVGAWGLDGVPRWWVRAHGERVSGVRWASDGGAVSVGWDGQVRRYPSPSVGTT